MRRDWTIFICAILCILLVLNTGCGDDNGPAGPGNDVIANPNPPTNPYLGSVSFPIMAWFGIPSDFIDREHYQDFADAGFNINFYFHGTEINNIRALSMAQEVGIKILVQDNRINPDSPVDETALKGVDDVVDRYKSFPALFGYHVRDEPNVGLYNKMAAIKNRILAKDPNHLVYANLFPQGPYSGMYGVSTYKEYMDKYMLVFKPQVLSFDHYPFRSAGFSTWYYQNLESIRDEALTGSVPFWAFTMSCAIDPTYPEPVEPWIRLQVYTDLAYGAQGIQYFTYGLPKSNTENFTTAILDANGVKTYIYDIAKEVNAEILALAPTIKRLHSTIVYHSEPLPQGTIGLPGGNFFITGVQGLELVIGCLQDATEQKYVFFVSREYENGGTARISVSNSVESFVEISKTGGGEEAPLLPEGNEIPIEFEPGDGRLFKINLK